MTQVLMPLNSSNTLHNHIHVAVRLKPFSDRELAMMREKRGQWIAKNGNTIQDRHGKESFQFDRVFDMQETTRDIFEADLQQMMINAPKGYNVTVLAYG